MHIGDFADRASDVEERARDAAIARVRAAAAAMPPANGRCFYCDEIVADGVRFCGADCRDEYEREARARKRNGQA